MREQVRYQVWIVAAAAVIFFVNLGGARLWDMDEALYASCAAKCTTAAIGSCRCSTATCFPRNRR